MNKTEGPIRVLLADDHAVVRVGIRQFFDQAVDIATMRAGGSLSSLFPEDVKREATQRYQNIQSQKRPYERFGQVWIGLVVASLIMFLVGSIRQRKGWIFWILVVLFLGPLGLLVWLATGRKQTTGNWQVILVEAVGDLIPTIVAFVTLTVGLVLKLGAPQNVTLLLFFISPLFIGWFIFQAPLLAFAVKKDYFQTLLMRIPYTWLAANLVIAGILWWRLRW